MTTYTARIAIAALPVGLALTSLGCSEWTLSAAATNPPVAQAYVVVPGEGEEAEEELQRYARLSFDSVFQLDGSQSFRDTPTGTSTEGLTYAWGIMQTPEGSVATFSDPLVAQPTFDPDVAGTYEFELVVTDADGLESRPSIVTAIAAPPENLTITLEWTTGGTDVDVHLIRPGGSYWTDDDCYFGNPGPDWGVVGSIVDNPALSRDDDDGGDAANPGVEEVIVQRPEDGDFEVVVTYYNDRNNDLSVTPGVTVSVDGAVLGVLEPVTLASEGEAWRAATIRWPEMIVEPIGEITTHEALGGPAYNEGS